MPEESQEGQDYYISPEALHGGVFQPQEDRTDLLMYTFYSGDVITEFRRSLRGEIRDKYGKIINVRKPVANDKGINGIMVHVEIAISKLTNLSDIDDDEVRTITKSFGHDLYDDMWVNRKDWGMMETNIRGLCNRLTQAIFLTLKRAEEGGDRSLIRGVHKSLAASGTGQKPSVPSNILKGLFK